MLFGHLIGPVLAHTQTVPPTETVNDERRLVFHCKDIISQNLPRIRIGRIAVALIKIEERTF